MADSTNPVSQLGGGLGDSPFGGLFGKANASNIRSGTSKDGVAPEGTRMVGQNRPRIAPKRDVILGG